MIIIFESSLSMFTFTPITHKNQLIEILSFQQEFNIIFCHIIRHGHLNNKSVFALIQKNGLTSSHELLKRNGVRNVHVKSYTIVWCF